ncbi:MAG: TolC family protein [Candidatus Accumulibacter meliphilus]|jgi:NodT family efflux transporter outer membrane factor (OMF) lipoprotein|uniref:TolC family protein n=1 Tax=Candidatus Accumulibacter meliphilus TaxID=2211374 RepID=A0A369XI84_9PROT|nr:MAG: TolC family protein [Candidatus Accumulibacter meliphilus]
MRAPIIILLGGLCGLVALAGCALQAPLTQSEVVEQALPATTHIPAAWQAESTTGPVADGWLKSFQDPLLEAIVAEAIANNLDLRVAAESVRVAEQQLLVVGAQLAPQISGQLGARSIRDKDQDDSFNSTLAYVGVAWEVDLWGRLRAQRAAAEAAFEVSALDYAQARQSLAALVAKTWYLAIETRQLVELGEQTVQVFGELLKLVEMRRSAGKDSDLDVVDVRAKLETAQGDLEGSRQAAGEVRRALEVLLGRYPAAELAVASSYPRLPPAAGAGAPIALLARRPDIVAAERAVLAAFRQQEAAQLALLPDFSLSLAGGRLGDNLLSLLRLNPWLAAAGIGVSIPIYEGGALRAQVEIASAQQAQAVAAYGALMLTAFREVESGLANEQLLARRLPFEEQAVVSRSAAVRIATIQYRAGRRDLLWVAQLQSAQFQGQAAVIKLRAVQGANRVRLHLALGDSFDATPAVTTSPLILADDHDPDSAH